MPLRVCLALPSDLVTVSFQIFYVSNVIISSVSWWIFVNSGHVFASECVTRPWQRDNYQPWQPTINNSMLFRRWRHVGLSDKPLLLEMFTNGKLSVKSSENPSIQTGVVSFSHSLPPVVCLCTDRPTRLLYTRLGLTFRHSCFSITYPWTFFNMYHMAAN